MSPSARGSNIGYYRLLLLLTDLGLVTVSIGAKGLRGVISQVPVYGSAAYLCQETLCCSARIALNMASSTSVSLAVGASSSSDRRSARRDRSWVAINWPLQGTHLVGFFGSGSV